MTVDLEPRSYRLPIEWFGIRVQTSPIHNRRAPAGYVAVSSSEPNSKGHIAYFHISDLEEATARPLVADVVDEGLHNLLVHLGWTPPAANS